MSIKASKADRGLPGVVEVRGHLRRMTACSRCGIQREPNRRSPAEYCRDCKSLLDYEERQANR